MVQQIPKDPRVTLMRTLGRATGVPERTPAQGELRGMVGVLLGCVQREFLLGVNTATARVPAVTGFDMIAAAAQHQPFGEFTRTTPFLRKTR
jgi:hypothetical protein